MILDSEPKRLSPIHHRHQTFEAHFELRAGWMIPEVYTAPAKETTALQEGVGLADISAWGKLTLKGDNAGAIVSKLFGEAPINSGNVLETNSNQSLVVKLTTDEFLIRTPPGAEKKFANSLEVEIASQNTFVSVIDQTSGLVGLALSGPKSKAVMTKLCAVHFDSKDFPNLHAVQSSFAKVRATIIRHDLGNLPTFELYTDCSYADYLWDVILDTGKEYGIQPVGWEALKGLNN